jgi:flagellar basal body-associated protein FliL
MQNYHNQMDKKMFSEKITIVLSISIVLIAMLAIVIFPFYIFNKNRSNNSFQSLENKGLYIEKENFSDENAWENSKSNLTNQLSYVVKLDKGILQDFKTRNKVIYYDHQNYISLEAYTVENGIKKELIVNSESFIYPYIILPEKTPDRLYIVVDGIIKNHGLKIVDFKDFSTMNNQLFSFLIFSLGIIFSMILSSIILTVFIT